MKIKIGQVWRVKSFEGLRNTEGVKENGGGLIHSELSFFKGMRSLCGNIIEVIGFSASGNIKTNSPYILHKWMLAECVYNPPEQQLTSLTFPINRINVDELITALNDFKGGFVDIESIDFTGEHPGITFKPC